jgi:predicted ATPase
MRIKKIRVENFKCFDHVDVKLEPFNIIIGPNASGKSNFIQLFDFLKNLNSYGLENAISMGGSVDYFRNIKLKDSRNFKVSVIREDKKSIAGLIDKNYYLNRYEFTYQLEIKFKGSEYEVENESIKQNIYIKERQENGYKENDKKISEGSIVVSRNGKEIHKEINFEKEFSSLKEKLKITPLNKSIEIDSKSSILQDPFISFPFSPYLFEDIKVYDFDPKLSKKATQFKGKNELEENGENLSIILNEIFSNKEAKRKFINLARDILPFFDDTMTTKQADKSFLISLKEKYFGDLNRYIPASFLSDGTVNVIAIIVALFFQNNDKISIIEEPERSLHPALMSKIVDLMREASKFDKQVIITTHNPEILRNSKLSELYFIKRGKDGYSELVIPSKRIHIKEFLANDVGIDELFLQNLIQ